MAEPTKVIFAETVRDSLTGLEQRLDALWRHL
jgi:hypothetical protein